MTGFDVFVPWLGLAIVLYFLYQVQRFIQRHLFGIGYLVARDRGPATLLFYLVLLPGVILHEISRYLIAGMLRIVPTHFTLFPDEQQDGTFELGFIHFGFVINPVYRAILDLVPLAVGIAATIIIGHFALGWTDFIGTLRTLDFYVISAAFQKLVNRPDFVLWSYVLFGIANTMLPTRKEARGLWLPIAILMAILGIFVVLGIWSAVYKLMMGPVASIVYGLTTVFGLVLFIDAIAGTGLWLIERGISAITHREVQYAAPANKLAKAAKPQARSVFELQLPLPAPPGKPGFRIRAPITTLPVPVGETRPAAVAAEEPITVERPSRPAIGAPAARPITPAPKPAALGSGNTSSVKEEPMEIEEMLEQEEAAKPKGLPVPKPPPLSGGTPAPKPAALGTPKNEAEKTEAAEKEAEAPAKPVSPPPLGAPKPAAPSPFGASAPAANKPPSSTFPARPATTTGTSTDADKDKTAEEPAKPASPFGAPKPASPFGTPAANKPPSSPFPARPATTTGTSAGTDKAAEEPVKPASPFGAPKPASPFGAPAANKPPASPFPARPATTTGTGTDKPASPFAPKPPAEAGKATGNLPAIRPNQRATPAPKSPVPVAGRPSPLSAPKASPNADDVIEGEVVDDNEPKYVPPEE